MKECFLIKIKAHIHSIGVQISKSQIINQAHYHSQGAKHLKVRLVQFSCQKRFDFMS